MLMITENYDLLFEDWLKDERAKLRSRSKGFVGDRAYRHFDGRVDIQSFESNTAKIIPALKDPEQLKHHSFYPFIRKDQKVRLYRVGRISQKLRPIMYASHNDACVYGFYAYILKQSYERRISGTPLAESVVAYRRIPRGDNSLRGKSNIDLVSDIYLLTKKYKKCAVLCLDVEKFFERLDHILIKEKWCKLLNTVQLPTGHYTVFKNVTNYRYVFLNEILFRLDYGTVRRGKFRYYDKRSKVGALCSGKVYNSKINTKNSNLIHKNKSGRGIPQGSPVSDIIANMYMEEFDKKMVSLISKYSVAEYRRYSDDILIFCPEEKAKEVYKFALQEIQKEKLTLKAKKSEILVTDLVNKSVKDITYSITGLDNHKDSKKQAFQYLGFEIDSEDIHLRSGTVAAHYRRAKKRAQKLKRKPKKRTTRKTPISTNRKRHWQYMLRSKEKLNSPRIARQVQKVLKRSKSF